MNLLTPEKVLQGMQEVRTGQTFNLSLPLDFPGGNVLNPRRQPPVLRPTLRGDKPNMNYQLWCDEPACTDVVCDDLVIMHLQYSTQWDSLAHVGSMFDANGDGVPEPVYYNGFRAGTDVVGPSSGTGAGIFGFPEIARESTSKAKALGIAIPVKRTDNGREVPALKLRYSSVAVHPRSGHYYLLSAVDRSLLVVDRAIDAVDRSVVIAVVDGDFTVKQLCRIPDGVLLRSGNDAYADIFVGEEQTLSVWGVVRWSIHQVWSCPETSR
jgi:hypothetical protein